MRAAAAPPSSPGMTVGRMESYHPPFDTDSSAIDQGFGHLFPALLDNSSKGRPGNIHPACRFLLTKTFEIGESHRFQFIDSDHHQINRPNSHRLRNEAHTGRFKADPAGFNGTRHSISSPNISSFEHTLIINVYPMSADVKCFLYLCFQTDVHDMTERTFSSPVTPTRTATKPPWRLSGNPNSCRRLELSRHPFRSIQGWLLKYAIVSGRINMRNA